MLIWLQIILHLFCVYGCSLQDYQDYVLCYMCLFAVSVCLLPELHTLSHVLISCTFDLRLITQCACHGLCLYHFNTVLDCVILALDYCLVPLLWLLTTLLAVTTFIQIPDCVFINPSVLTFVFYSSTFAFCMFMSYFICLFFSVCAVYAMSVYLFIKVFKVLCYVFSSFIPFLVGVFLCSYQIRRLRLQTTHTQVSRII